MLEVITIGYIVGVVVMALYVLMLVVAMVAYATNTNNRFSSFVLSEEDLETTQGFVNRLKEDNPCRGWLFHARSVLIVLCVLCVFMLTWPAVAVFLVVDFFSKKESNA